MRLCETGAGRGSTSKFLKHGSTGEICTSKTKVHQIHCEWAKLLWAICGRTFWTAGASEWGYTHCVILVDPNQFITQVLSFDNDLLRFLARIQREGEWGDDVEIEAGFIRSWLRQDLESLHYAVCWCFTLSGFVRDIWLQSEGLNSADQVHDFIISHPSLSQHHQSFHPKVKIGKVPPPLVTSQRNLSKLELVGSNVLRSRSTRPMATRPGPPELHVAPHKHKSFIPTHGCRGNFESKDLDGSGFNSIHAFLQNQSVVDQIATLPRLMRTFHEACDSKWPQPIRCLSNDKENVSGLWTHRPKAPKAAK